jgi:hypothetical protein
MSTDSQIRFLSKNYSSLHGLYAVPVGLCLFLVSLWANMVHYPIKSLFLPVAFSLACLLLYLAVDRYYKRTFGQVKPLIADQRRYWLVACAGGLLAVAAVLVDFNMHLPVNFIGLLFAALFLFDKPRVTFPLNNFSALKLSLAVIIVLVSIASVFLGRDWWNTLGVRTTTIGVTMTVGLLVALQGLACHFFFIRSLPAAEAKDE